MLKESMNTLLQGGGCAGAQPPRPLFRAKKIDYGSKPSAQEEKYFYFREKALLDTKAKADEVILKKEEPLIETFQQPVKKPGVLKKLKSLFRR